MTGKRTRFTPDEKVCTVTQMLSPKTNVAELCSERTGSGEQNPPTEAIGIDIMPVQGSGRSPEYNRRITLIENAAAHGAGWLGAHRRRYHTVRC